MFQKKNSFAFNAKARMKLCGMLCLVAPLAIGVKLFYVQTFLHDKFSSKAEQKIYNFLKEDRFRGQIYDVNGNFLAESVRTHSCGVNKRYVKDKTKTIAFLSENLGLTKKEVQKRWNQNKNFFFVAKKIKPETYMQMRPVLRTALGQGLELTPEYERIHPYGDSAIDILGEANPKNCTNEALLKKSLEALNSLKVSRGGSK